MGIDAHGGSNASFQFTGRVDAAHAALASFMHVGVVRSIADDIYRYLKPFP
jgi:hypothetical protein